jgi:FkbM family methyltransferase
VELTSRHDLLTVAEIFCRGDYDPVAGRNVVDIGANIGIASLYFLTRDSDVTVTCFEPNPINVERLRRTLSGFEDRYRVEQVAVAVESGTGRFRAEDTGRYGRLDPSGDLEVDTVGIGEALRSIAAQKGRIDLLKIDTEGSEPELVAALPSDVPIGEVLWEDLGKIRRMSRDDGPAVAKRP